MRCEKPARPRRCDQGDDRRQEAGDLRLPRGRARQLLPDDPVGQGAQRDAAGRGRHRRGGRARPSARKARCWSDAAGCPPDRRCSQRRPRDAQDAAHALRWRWQRPASSACTRRRCVAAQRSRLGSGRQHQGGGDAPRAICSARQGATKAFVFIDACYKTHSLSSEYTKAFEACIAQDYLETQILALIYSRMPPEALKRMGAPSPQLLAADHGPARDGCLRQVQGHPGADRRSLQEARRRARVPAVLHSRCSPTPRCRFARRSWRRVPLPKRSERTDQKEVTTMAKPHPQEPLRRPRRMRRTSSRARCRCWSTTSRACSPASSACSPAAATTSTA